MSENPDYNFSMGYGIADFLRSGKKNLEFAAEVQRGNRRTGLIREAQEDLKNARTLLEEIIGYEDQIGPVRLREIQDELEAAERRARTMQA